MREKTFGEVLDEAFLKSEITLSGFPEKVNGTYQIKQQDGFNLKLKRKP